MKDSNCGRANNDDRHKNRVDLVMIVGADTCQEVSNDNPTRKTKKTAMPR
jgi:hypothetical protein